MARRISIASVLKALIAAGAGALAVPNPAQAVPSFAAQTGQPCAMCHVGSFGPQLTPFGRAFKIGGYTQSGGDGWASQIPLSAMVLQSFTNTSASIPQDQVTPHYGTNDNYALDQISVFLAGRVTDNTGGFSQFTYSNIPNASHLDNTDLRPYTTTFDLGDTDLRVGMSVNNNPTVQDPYNSTPAWGYPFVASGLAPVPAAQPILVGAFATNSIGVTGYGWWDKKLYVEAGGYQTMSSWTLARTGNAYGPGASRGTMPYVRAAYEWNWNEQSAHIGGIFMQSNVNPAIADRQSDGSFGHDTYTDYAVDGSYELYLDNSKHIVVVQGIYIHENQSLGGSAGSVNNANANAGSPTSFGNNYHTDSIRMNASYWYDNTYGVTVGWQGLWGPANPVLYGPGSLTGSNNSKPSSNAFSIEADWVPFGKEDSWARPFANLKLGIQYIAYTQFNGGGNNYDGFNRNAGNNNTLYAFAWLAF
jgi:hypothetical protein